MFYCEGLGMHDFRVDGLLMIGFVLLAALLSGDVDDGFGSNSSYFFLKTWKNERTFSSQGIQNF